MFGVVFLFSREFAHKMSMVLLQNQGSKLHTLDLSNNLIEDRGKLKHFVEINCFTVLYLYAYIYDILILYAISKHWCCKGMSVYLYMVYGGYKWALLVVRNFHSSIFQQL